MPQLDCIDAATGRPFTVDNPREVAPGVYTGAVPPAVLPRFGVVELHALPNGTYVPRIITWQSWVGVALQEQDFLGFGISRKVVLRLARAGFIDYMQPSPGAIRVSVQSFLRHVEACRVPGYWTLERVERYRKTRLDEDGAACPGRSGNSKPKA